MADYDLELEKVAEKIKKEKAKTVLIQLPDGLKPKAPDNWLQRTTLRTVAEPER